MLLDTPTLILLGSSTVLISMILLMYNGIVHDIYGQIHDAQQLFRRYKRNTIKYRSALILFIYSAFAGYPFFMGSITYPKYYMCLDTIVFGSVCSLLFITYIQPYHQQLKYNLRSFSQDICNRVSNIALTFFAVCIMASYLLPIEIWYMMIPISGVTPIVVYLWIRDTYFHYTYDAVISRYILPCLYAGIVLNALLGAHIQNLYTTM